MSHDGEKNLSVDVSMLAVTDHFGAFLHILFEIFVLRIECDQFHLIKVYESRHSFNTWELKKLVTEVLRIREKTSIC